MIIIIKKQQNSKCKLCDDREETINHISECSNVEPKSIRQDTPERGR